VEFGYWYLKITYSYVETYIINAKGDVVLQSKSDQDASEVLKEFQEMLSKTRRQS
jgi:hypothetical protein